ncbi:MAG: lipopolysaccharide heptosyltransferase II [Phycisphaerales bacterium]|jgi:heptosyltransferase-2
MDKQNLLVWLPSPMGDAILCTPALRAIRKHFPEAKITYLGNTVAKEVLSPCSFCDEWMEAKDQNIFDLAKELKKRRFDEAILFKNSFGSALSVFLAGIKSRIGYSRDGRGILLTEELYPPKDIKGKFMPISMIDYYLAIASWLAAETSDRTLELAVATNDYAGLKAKLSDVVDSPGPLIVLVPGGAFGLSKCWPSERFAETADWLIDNYNAKVLISVAPAEAERKIATQICGYAEHELVNLAERALSLGELKVLFSLADLVICNDTGPRHIAIAFGRKVITLFGPNDPAWTQTGYENEVQIIGKAPCVPCLKSKCQQKEHLCMESITTERVCGAAVYLMQGKKASDISDTRQQFVQVADALFVDEDYKDDFKSLGLTSIDAVFSFSGGKNLTKKNLTPYRSRIEFEMGTPAKKFFMKRYENPPTYVQFEKWFSRHDRVSCGLFDLEPTRRLTACGIGAAKIVAYGQQWDGLFEKRSFLITEEITDARSLEERLPECFYAEPTEISSRQCQDFIVALAKFIRRFHDTALRHRDLYLCHIFYDGHGNFSLIDLARAFEPLFFSERYRIKDIAQLYYSAPGKYFSESDRLMFYLAYAGKVKLDWPDKFFIWQVQNKVKQMAEHDKKHGRVVPFES